MFEEGLARLVMSTENSARNAALQVLSAAGPDARVAVLSSAGNTGMVGIAAARILMNWLGPQSLTLGFLVIDDYARGPVHVALGSARELPIEYRELLEGYYEALSKDASAKRPASKR